MESWDWTVVVACVALSEKLVFSTGLTEAEHERVTANNAT